MSLRSNSPCTRTSSPISSCTLSVFRICSSMNASEAAGSVFPVAQLAPGVAYLASAGRSRSVVVVVEGERVCARRRAANGEPAADLVRSPPPRDASPPGCGSARPPPPRERPGVRLELSRRRGAAAQRPRQGRTSPNLLLGERQPALSCIEPLQSSRQDMQQRSRGARPTGGRSAVAELERVRAAPEIGLPKVAPSITPNGTSTRLRGPRPEQARHCPSGRVTSTCSRGPATGIQVVVQTPNLRGEQRIFA